MELVYCRGDGRTARCAGPARCVIRAPDGLFRDHGMSEAAPQPNDIELADIVRRFTAARVLVVGDVMLDRYVGGSARRLSPEAPIPVLRPTSSHARLGGAANVALNVATLGGQAKLIGVVGADAAGTELDGLLADARILRH